MDSFQQDLGVSVRMLVLSPGFTLAAVAVLAPGIGSTTAILSVVNTVLPALAPLPDPDGSH